MLFGSSVHMLNAMYCTFMSTAAQPGQLSALSCNFESANKCGYTDDTEDFKWTQKHGSTNSSNTGPTTDHTKGTLSGNNSFVTVL